MNEKEFNFEEFPDADPELETPEEIQAESEDEEVREVSLVFPENEAWPPQPESQETQESDQVKTYSEAVGELNQEKPDKETGEPTPVIIYNGKPANNPVVVNGTKLNGFYFYTIKHQTGITLNGKHFDAGSYWFDQSTYEGILIIDLPFQ